MLFNRLKWLVILCLLMSPALGKVPDFTFIHTSDVHAPSYRSEKVIAQIPTLGEIDLTPYNVKALAPSFVVDSGDACEFGGGNGAWDAYVSYWKDVTIPVYPVLGNHDGPWFAVRPLLKKTYGGYYWSFDKFGCHFIGLDTSSPQDPRASVTREELLWLADDLKKVNPKTPVFLIVHHPITDTYYGSPYAVAQFMDMLRPYNLVAVLAGHGHNATCRKLLGVDCTDGGATCGPLPKCVPGFSIVSVLNNTLRIAFKPEDQPTATKAILEKPMPTGSTYPNIKILSPKEGGTCKSGHMALQVRVSNAQKPITKATWSADDRSFKPDTLPMSLNKDVWEAGVPYTDWTPGRHYIRVTFTDESGAEYQKSVGFYTDPENRLVWRTLLAGSVKGTPTVTADAVYVGATGGKVYCLDKKTGKEKWSYQTGGDVASKVLAVDDAVYVGASDGKLYALTTKGKLKWTFEAKEGIYSSPVYSDGLVLFGCNDSNFYAVDAVTGQQKWVCEEPGYTIEIKPFVADGAVYFGAWDQYLYAVDVKTGRLKWKCLGHGSEVRPRAKAYYSPADCGPVASSGKVFVADRDYYLTIVDATTGQPISSITDVVAPGLSYGRQAVYLRKGSGLSKISLDGNEIWKASAETEIVPGPPVAKDRHVVYLVSRLGLLQAFNASDGTPLWKYQVTPMMHVLSGPEIADEIVYVSGMDGTVTAINCRPFPPSAGSR